MATNKTRPAPARLYDDIICDPDNEAVAVGLAMRSMEFYRTIIGSLTSDCFVEPRAKACFNALVELSSNKGMPTVPAMKAMAYVECSKVNVGLINQWRFQAGEILDPSGTIDILHEYRRRRQSVALFSEKSEELIRSGLGDSIEIISSVEKTLTEIKTSTNRRVTNGDEYFEIIGDINGINSGTSQPFVSLFLTKLDHEFSGGFQYGTLNVIGARPGTGKTAVTMWWLRNWHTSGIPCGFISLEMTPKQIAYREYSMETGIPYSRIMRGEVTDTEKKELLQTAYKLKENRFHRECVGSCDVLKLRTLMMDMYFNHGCKVIVIDYFQRMRFDGKENLTNVMGAVANEIKSLAVQYGVCVVLLSQLSRDAEKEPPKSYHLRNSGMIEEAADTITLLHRPELYDESQRNVLQFLIEKNRNGESNITVNTYCEIGKNIFADSPQYAHHGGAMAMDTPF